MAVVGTSHKYQKANREVSAEAVSAFKSHLINLCTKHSVNQISEEFNLEALKEQGLSSSVAEQVAGDLNIKHQYADPDRSQRRRLGIRQENDIRAENFMDGLEGEALEKHIDERMTEYYRIREGYWCDMIESTGIWPTLFICGANHFDSFCELLALRGVTVMKEDSDWELTS